MPRVPAYPTEHTLESFSIFPRKLRFLCFHFPKQASLTLATTLINIIHRDSSLNGSEGRSEERSDERGGGRNEWAMRLEAAQLLKA